MIHTEDCDDILQLLVLLGGQQVVHLEQLGAVFELAALHRLGSGVINVISIKIYSHIKTTR